MPLVNYVLITIEIRSELPLREAWRLTMIEWPLLLLDVYSSFYSSFPTIVNSYAGLNSQFSKPAKKEKVFGRISNYP